jgi:hypothetical protein
MMNTQATQHLIATVRDAASTDADMNAAAQSFFNAVGRASLREANDALSTLAGSFSLDDPKRAAFLALVCGALVERGCDPLAIAQPLRQRLQSLLEAAAALADACCARMPKSEDEDQDPGEAFEQVRQQLASEMPRENAAWEALNRFWPPAIAVFSVSAPSRAAARGLRDLAAGIADHHEAGHWLRLMLSVLDDEPILVIEPQTALGILARISGVVENFQLNVLLMDGFPKSGFLARRRIPQRVADVARGIGPQQTDDTVTGVWNLYTWKAIGPGLKLPDPNDYGASDHWIWNEGCPEDIPVFQDRRVILLGPASYPRSWRSQRMFDRLAAKLECERKLTRAEITDWLQRMLAAKSAS